MKSENEIQRYYVILENGFGIIGAIFWSFQLIPQACKNWKRKSINGLSREMILLWAFSGCSFGIYAIILKLSIPLLIQPQIFSIIALLNYVQYFYYDSPKFEGNKIKCGVLFILMTMFVAGIEVGAVYGINYANIRKVSWPENAIGIISVVLLIIGFVPQFIEIYCVKRVIGISLLFMALDMAGALFSTISLIFRPPPFDVLVAFKYITVFVLDSLIVILYYFLNWCYSRKESNYNGERGEDNLFNEVFV